MGARIQGAQSNGQQMPIQRRDRSLDLTFGVHPESMREDESVFGSWADCVWPGWTSGWMGFSGNTWTGSSPALDWGPNYIPNVWTFDLHWSGGKQLPYTIAGQCIDSNGNPVSGATVELYYSSSPQGIAGTQNGAEYMVASTVSDANGNYAFAVKDNTTPYFVMAWTTGAAGITARNLVGS